MKNENVTKKKEKFRNCEIPKFRKFQNFNLTNFQTLNR